MQSYQQVVNYDLLDSQIQDPLEVNYKRAQNVLGFLSQGLELTQENIKNWHESIIQFDQKISILVSQHMNEQSMPKKLKDLCQIYEEIRIKFDIYMQKVPQELYQQLQQMFIDSLKVKPNDNSQKNPNMCQSFNFSSQIYQKEDRQTEYKNYQLNSLGKEQYRDIIKKTITSFLNCQGGTIYLGIRDFDLTVQGIDLSRKNIDELKNIVTEIKRQIEPDCSQLVNVDFIPVKRWGAFYQGKWIVRIKVAQGDLDTVYAYHKQGDKYCFESAFRDDGSCQRYELGKFMTEIKNTQMKRKQQSEPIQYAEPDPLSHLCEANEVQNKYQKFKEEIKINFKQQPNLNFYNSNNNNNNNNLFQKKPNPSSEKNQNSGSKQSQGAIVCYRANQNNNQVDNKLELQELQSKIDQLNKQIKEQNQKITKFQTQEQSFQQEKMILQSQNSQLKYQIDKLQLNEQNSEKISQLNQQKDQEIFALKMTNNNIEVQFDKEKQILQSKIQQQEDHIKQLKLMQEQQNEMMLMYKGELQNYRQQQNQSSQIQNDSNKSSERNMQQDKFDNNYNSNNNYNNNQQYYQKRDNYNSNSNRDQSNFYSKRDKYNANQNRDYYQNRDQNNSNQNRDQNNQYQKRDQNNYYSNKEENNFHSKRDQNYNNQNRDQNNQNQSRDQNNFNQNSYKDKGINNYQKQENSSKQFITSDDNSSNKNQQSERKQSNNDDDQKNNFSNQSNNNLSQDKQQRKNNRSRNNKNDESDKKDRNDSFEKKDNSENEEENSQSKKFNNASNSKKVNQFNQNDNSNNNDGFTLVPNKGKSQIIKKNKQKYEEVIPGLAETQRQSLKENEDLKKDKNNIFSDLSQVYDTDNPVIKKQDQENMKQIPEKVDDSSDDEEEGKEDEQEEEEEEEKQNQNEKQTYSAECPKDVDSLSKSDLQKLKYYIAITFAFDHTLQKGLKLIKEVFKQDELDILVSKQNIIFIFFENFFIAKDVWNKIKSDEGPFSIRSQFEFLKLNLKKKKKNYQINFNANLKLKDKPENALIYLNNVKSDKNDKEITIKQELANLFNCEYVIQALSGYLLATEQDNIFNVKAKKTKKHLKSAKKSLGILVGTNVILKNVENFNQIINIIQKSIIDNFLFKKTVISQDENQTITLTFDSSVDAYIAYSLLYQYEGINKYFITENKQIQLESILQVPAVDL